MRSLSGKESRYTGKWLLYRCGVYASDSAKASAFIQEYVANSSRKSVRLFRKAVMDQRCLARSILTPPRLQIEEAFIPGEPQQALFQLMAAGPYGIALDLRHLLSSISSSWISSWCPQSWRSTYVITFLKKGKVPGRYRPTADFDIREGLGKTRRQPPVMVA